MRDLITDLCCSKIAGIKLLTAQQAKDIAIVLDEHDVDFDMLILLDAIEVPE